LNGPWPFPVWIQVKTGIDGLPRGEALRGFRLDQVVQDGKKE
jgi:hypothetical protein